MKIGKTGTSFRFIDTFSIQKYRNFDTVKTVGKVESTNRHRNECCDCEFVDVLAYRYLIPDGQTIR